MGDLIIEDDDRPDNWSVDTEFQRNARNRQPSAGTTYMPEIRQGVLPPFQASFFVQGKFTPVDLQQPPVRDDAPHARRAGALPTF